jgi:hypothetical protein
MPRNNFYLFVTCKVKVRVSLTGEDVRLLLNTTDSVMQAKAKLQVR